MPVSLTLHVVGINLTLTSRVGMVMVVRVLTSCLVVSHPCHEYSNKADARPVNLGKVVDSAEVVVLLMRFNGASSVFA